jgi:hypothetical protein
VNAVDPEGIVPKWLKKFIAKQIKKIPSKALKKVIKEILDVFYKKLHRPSENEFGQQPVYYQNQRWTYDKSACRIRKEPAGRACLC